MRGILEVQHGLRPGDHRLLAQLSPPYPRQPRQRIGAAGIRVTGGQAHGKALHRLAGKVQLITIGKGLAVRHALELIEGNGVGETLVIDHHLLGELRAEIIETHARFPAGDGEMNGRIAAESPRILQRMAGEIPLKRLGGGKYPDMVGQRMGIAQAPAAVGAEHQPLDGFVFQSQAGREFEALARIPVGVQPGNGREFFFKMESIFPERTGRPQAAVLKRDGGGTQLGKSIIEARQSEGKMVHFRHLVLVKQVQEGRRLRRSEKMGSEPGIHPLPSAIRHKGDILAVVLIQRNARFQISVDIGVGDIRSPPGPRQALRILAVGRLTIRPHFSAPAAVVQRLGAETHLHPVGRIVQPTVREAEHRL